MLAERGHDMSDADRGAANRAARDARKEAYLRAIYDRHLAGFRALAPQPAAAAARRTHDTMDAVLAQDRAKDPASRGIRCGKGCCHCCHEAVEIWPQEARLLVETVRTSGVMPDRARLERQRRHSVETWRAQPPADRACVFLGGDGACTVYESRPNACRKLQVLTDPALCDASQHQPDSVGRWFSWEAELMESAALEVFGAHLMPAALLAVLAEDEGPAAPGVQA